MLSRNHCMTLILNILKMYMCPYADMHLFMYIYMYVCVYTKIYSVALKTEWIPWLFWFCCFCFRFLAVPRKANA